MIFVAEVDETMRAVVGAAGYALVRHSFRMAIPIDDRLVSPVWHEGIEVATLRPGDELAVYEAHQEAFAEHWEYTREPLEEWRRWFVESLRFDPSFWFVAWGSR